MNRLTLALLPVAILCVAAKGGCGDSADPIVGASDGGPDGACSSVGVCSEPNIPVGCHLGRPTCTNGVADCPPVICPDGGEGDAQDGDAGVGGDGSAPDAGPFLCAGDDGSVITCDGRTQYCQVAEGGAIGVTHPPACIELPTACLSNRTCACVNGAGSGTPCDDNGGDITVTQLLP